MFVFYIILAVINRFIHIIIIIIIVFVKGLSIESSCVLLLISAVPISLFMN